MNSDPVSYTQLDVYKRQVQRLEIRAQDGRALAPDDTVVRKAVSYTHLDVYKRQV